MKNPIQSKTLWLNALVTLVPVFLPLAQDWIAQHPAVASSALGVANIVLRFLTSGPVSLTPQAPSVKVK